MPLWQNWLEMADESERAANVLLGEGKLRPASSRYYYAAFQAATALLHYLNLTPPVVDGVAWEHWGHDKTPAMIEANAAKAVKSRSRRRTMRRLLERLYILRLYADYVGSEIPRFESVQAAQKDAVFFIAWARAILPNPEVGNKKNEKHFNGK